MRKLASLAAALLLVAAPAHAQLTIEIIGGGANQIPVAVLPFVGETALPQSITEIVEQDLTRSGRFRAIFVGGISPVPSEIAQVNFADWKSRLADALVIGQATRLPDGRFEVRFRLLDVQKQVQIGGIAFTLSASQVRLTAHKIADFIYEKLTGERGVFSTRIAYVVKQGTRFELRVADADGQNAQSILGSNEPIMSPSWSPDGTRMAYVSFQNKKPILFVQNLSASKQPAPVANYRGSNSAPAWSPDGKQLAAVLTRDGTSQIYLMNAD
ncbi:MAG TPA: Tol-Pal system protein TolB, partial [Burkholderiales bacterium]|nr:Tol-Pal system protein TolB [Burkholderiales bacterium]